MNIGVHGTDRFWSEMLLWLNNTYGRDGEDCLWMPAAEEYFEYNYLRHHAVVNARVTENTLTLTVEMPGGLYFYYPSLTINLLGVDPGACTAVGGGETVTGLSWGRGRTADDGAEALMVNFDCRACPGRARRTFRGGLRGRPFGGEPGRRPLFRGHAQGLRLQGEASQTDKIDAEK